MLVFGGRESPGVAWILSRGAGGEFVQVILAYQDLLFVSYCMVLLHYAVQLDLYIMLQCRTFYCNSDVTNFGNSQARERLQVRKFVMSLATRVLPSFSSSSLLPRPLGSTSLHHPTTARKQRQKHTCKRVYPQIATISEYAFNYAGISNKI